MFITLSPMRRDDPLLLERRGEVLVVNGTPVDLSNVAEGKALPAEATGCRWIIGEIHRLNGRLHLTLILPHGPDAPRETLFPADIDLRADGPVGLPPWGGAPMPAEEAAEEAAEAAEGGIAPATKATLRG